MVATTSELVSTLRKHIQLQPGERLYAVVDAARDDGKLAFEIRDRFQLRLRTLFQGEAAQYMTDAAPYFIDISAKSEFLEVWSEHWGTNAGILLTSSVDTQKVFRHLREIFIVNDDAGQEYFFRYFDPRVLSLFLPTCMPKEVKNFFGPIDSIYMDDLKTTGWIRYSQNNGHLAFTTHGKS